MPLTVAGSLTIGAKTYIDEGFSMQNKKDTILETKNFHSIFRFKPAATLVSLVLYTAADIEITYVHYVHPRVGIPMDIGLAYINQTFGFSMLSGIEAVPVIHREKSGLYLNLEAGFVYLDAIGFACTTNIGYQLVTKKRFVFTPAVGLKYEGINKTLGLNLMLDIGFAF